MQPGDPEIGLEPNLQATRLHHHLRFLGRREVGRARSEYPHLSTDSLWLESWTGHTRRSGIADHVHAGRGAEVVERGLVLFGHPAHQTLTLPLSHGDSQARCIRRGLARGQDDLRYPATKESTEIETSPSVQLIELDSAQL